MIDKEQIEKVLQNAFNAIDNVIFFHRNALKNLLSDFDESLPLISEMILTFEDGFTYDDFIDRIKSEAEQEIDVDDLYFYEEAVFDNYAELSNEEPKHSFFLRINPNLINADVGFIIYLDKNYELAFIGMKDS